MIGITHSEAQLFRLLAQFFGRDRVVPHMSVLAVCGGELPESIFTITHPLNANGSLGLWAEDNKCLFTIVDDDDNPKMVVEFFSDFDDVIDPQEEEHHRLIEPILRMAGVRYITITAQEFSEMLDPRCNLDIFTLLKAKVDQVEAMV